MSDLTITPVFDNYDGYEEQVGYRISDPLGAVKGGLCQICARGYLPDCGGDGGWLFARPKEGGKVHIFSVWLAVKTLGQIQRSRCGRVRVRL